MDSVAVRWESLAFVVATLALAAWALIDAARTPSGSHRDRSCQLVLEVDCPGQRSKVVRFKNQALIGRGPQCHIILHDAAVSKEHALVRVNGSQILVEDLQSTNGTLVNGKVIAAPTAIEPGDRIGLGANVIWFLGQAPSQTA
jgi:hypothetical protein